MRRDTTEALKEDSLPSTPYNIVIERQYATDTKKAESQFTGYLSNPQRWARYTYALNNPFLYTDPHGEDVTIYRPAREGAGSKEDYGHIFIYVRNDETGESAYFDYVADGYPPTITYLNNVDQNRIDAHASLTIATTADQEQAILGGIKEMQKSSADFELSLGNVIKGCESTCTSQSVDLLQRAGLNFGGLAGHMPSTAWQSAFAQYSNESLSYREKGFFRQMFMPSPLENPNFNRPATGVECGHDLRGQARTLDTRAVNNTKLFFWGGKRVECS